MYTNSIVLVLIRFPLILTLTIALLLSGCSGSSDTETTASDPNSDTGTNNDPSTDFVDEALRQPQSPFIEITDGDNFVAGYWGKPDVLVTSQFALGEAPTVSSQKILQSSNQNIHLSWIDNLVDGDIETQTLKLLHGEESNPDHQWSELTNQSLFPAGITNDATDIQFTVNSVKNEAYALWHNGTEYNVSTFLKSSDGSRVFEGTAVISDGHAPQIVVNSNGDAYIVKQDHLENGFGISVHKRIDSASWSDAVQLARADETSEVSMPNHFLTASASEDNNINGVWLEEQDNSTKLNLATYNIADNTWSNVSTIIDSSNSGGIELSSIKTAIISGSVGKLRSLVLFQDDGTNKAIYSIDNNTADVWEAPVQRDLQTETKKISSEDLSYVFNLAETGAVAWVETDNATNVSEIVMMRKIPGDAWSLVTKVADSSVGNIESRLQLSINNQGLVHGIWIEKDDANVQHLFSTIQLPGKAWSKKELVQTFPENQLVHPMSLITQDGVPWISWILPTSTEFNDVLTIYLAKRLMIAEKSILSELVEYSIDGSIFTGNSNSDNPNWLPNLQVNSNIVSVDNEAEIGLVSLSNSPDGNLFSYWQTLLDPDSEGEFEQQDVTISRSDVDDSGNISWSSTNYSPFGYTATSRDFEFFPIPGATNENANGIAIWKDAAEIITSEFNGSTGVFAANVALPNGFRPKILNTTTNSYLFMDTVVDDGYALNMYQRTGENQWSDPVQLIRADNTNPFTVMNHFKISVVDSDNNIRVVWVQRQGDVFSLQTANFVTGTGNWDVISEIGINDQIGLGSLRSGVISSNSSSDSVNVILHQEIVNTTNLFSIQYTATNGWETPVNINSQDDANKAITLPAISQNAAGDVLVGWVESDVNATPSSNLILSRLYTHETGWSDIQQVINTPTSSNISDLNVVISQSGDAITTWLEVDDTNKTLITSIRPINSGTWLTPETIIQLAILDENIITVSTSVTADNTAVVIWPSKELDGDNHVFVLNQVERKFSISNTTDDTGSGEDDSGDDGSGSSDDDAGSGDEPSVDIITGSWTVAELIQSTEIAKNLGSIMTPPKLKINDTGELFAQWNFHSNLDQNSRYAKQKFNLIRRSLDDTGSFIWSDPTDSNFLPTGYDENFARNANLTITPTTNSGMAIWNQNGKTFTSEFQNDTSAFSTNMELPNSTSHQVISANDGSQYLLVEEQVIEGFALRIYKRSAENEWVTPQVLYRTNFDAYEISNSILMATIDSENIIHVVWIEKQIGQSTYALKTATYNATNETWGQISNITSSGIKLNKVLTGVVGASPDTKSVNLLLHEKNGLSHTVFGITFDPLNGWQFPFVLNQNSDTVNQISIPSFATNPSGFISVAWLETLEAFDIDNNAIVQQQIVSKRFDPITGWQNAEVAKMIPENYVAAGIEITLNNLGESSLIWKEVSADETNIVASNYILSNVGWSEKEIIFTSKAADIIVKDLTIVLDKTNTPTIMWTSKQTVNQNEVYKVFRSNRLSSISDSLSGDSGNGTDGGDGIDSTPISENWTDPTLAIQSIRNGDFNYNSAERGQLLIDGLNNSIVNLSLSYAENSNGGSVNITDNFIGHSADGIAWESLLENTTLFDDLTTVARVELIKGVPSTGSLVGLLRDSNQLYVIQYDQTNGWGKVILPEVSTDIDKNSIQISSDATGLVTVAWFEQLADTFDVQANVKHYSVDTDWQATQSIVIQHEKILTPLFVNNNGEINLAWLVTNPNNLSNFSVRLASYSPSQGWSDVKDGPSGIQNTYPKSLSNENNIIIIDSDFINNHVINAYVVSFDGSWIQSLNINQKQQNDQIVLVQPSETQIAIGEAGHFVVAWNELIVNQSGNYELRFKTSAALIEFDPVENSEVMNWTVPSVVGAMESDLESDLKMLVSNTGDIYAVWLSGLNRVYVNHATVDGTWDDTPDLLADYNIDNNVVALNPNIVEDNSGNIRISWEQFSKTSAVTTHNVWFVQNK